MSEAERGYETVPRDLYAWMREYPERERALTEALKDADFWEEWAKGSARRLTETQAERDRLAADVAEAHSEIERLRAVLRELDDRLSWHTTCKTCARILDSAYEETCRAEEAETERDRYRLAWLSARRRAAREVDYAAEAVRRGLV